MDKKSVRDRIIEIGIVPVIRASSSREALLAAEAVAVGGIPIVEITMTVPGAVEVIRELAKTNSSKILIGAGTVLDAEAARRCRDAGAQFLVSPALNVETIEFATKENFQPFSQGQAQRSVKTQHTKRSQKINCDIYTRYKIIFFTTFF